MDCKVLRETRTVPFEVYFSSESVCDGDTFRLIRASNGLCWLQNQRSREVLVISEQLERKRNVD